MVSSSGDLKEKGLYEWTFSLGIYQRQSYLVNGKSLYKHRNADAYLYFIPPNKWHQGVWMVINFLKCSLINKISVVLLELTI